MSHFINGSPKIFWCTCSYVWWCSEYNLSHYYDDICQRFTNWFMWCIIIHNHRSKLNRTASMVIARFSYRPLTKAIFSGLEICVRVLNRFWGGTKAIKFIYKIKPRDLNLHDLVWNSDLRPLLSCAGNLWWWFNRRKGSWNVEYFEWGIQALPLSLYIRYLGVSELTLHNQ